MKKPKSGANEKESADILKDLRNALNKASVQKTQGEASPASVQDEQPRSVNFSTPSHVIDACNTFSAV